VFQRQQISQASSQCSAVLAQLSCQPVRER
jgi:hypothetical protein